MAEPKKQPALLRVVPCTVKAATAWVASVHRHLKDELQGALFACALSDAGPHEWRGVGIVANPPRVWQGTGRVVIARIGTDGARNGCSMLYGALCKAARALGYVEAWTYTLPEEPGSSLRAAGFVEVGLTDGGEWDRESRPREPAERPDRKRRWVRVLSDVKPWAAPVAVEPEQEWLPLFGEVA